MTTFTKRATLTLAGLLLLIAGATRAQVRGDWTAKRDRGKPGNAGQPGTFHLELERGHNQQGQTVEIADFTGLTAGHFTATGPTPASFSLRREAGTVTFEGEFRNGIGRGEFSFAPNPSYLAELREMGVRVDRSKRHGQSEGEELLSLAVIDVSTDFIRSMKAIGYDESLDDYVAMRIFGVDPELVGEFRELGMTLSADELVAGRIHGVTPAYVREMRAFEQRAVDYDELIATRIHGATPEFIGEMRELGYGDLDLDDYVAFRIHGVTPEFVEELAALGYRDLDGDDLVAFRIHGVSPGFVKELAELGYEDVDADHLVAFRIHGVTPEMIRELAEDGYTDVDPDDLVSMRIHGRRWR